MEEKDEILKKIIETEMGKDRERWLKEGLFRLDKIDSTISRSNNEVLLAWVGYLLYIIYTIYNHMTINGLSVVIAGLCILLTVMTTHGISKASKLKLMLKYSIENKDTLISDTVILILKMDNTIKSIKLYSKSIFVYLIVSAIIIGISNIN